MRTRNETRSPDELKRARRGLSAPTYRPGNSQSPGAVPHLRRALGNQAVGEAIQTKLAVGPVDDPYEREADRMAARIMRARANPAVPSDIVAHRGGNGGRPTRLIPGSDVRESLLPTAQPLKLAILETPIPVHGSRHPLVTFVLH